MSDSFDGVEPAPAIIAPERLQEIALAIGATVDEATPNRLLWPELGVYFDLHDYDPPMMGDVLVAAGWLTEPYDGRPPLSEGARLAQAAVEGTDSEPKLSFYWNTPTKAAVYVAAAALSWLGRCNAHASFAEHTHAAVRRVLERAPLLQAHIERTAAEHPAHLRVEMAGQLAKTAATLVEIERVEALGWLAGQAPRPRGLTSEDFGINREDQLMLVRATLRLLDDPPVDLLRYMTAEPPPGKNARLDALNHRQALMFAATAVHKLRWMFEEVMRGSTVAKAQDERAAALLSGDGKP